MCLIVSSFLARWLFLGNPLFNQTSLHFIKIQSYMVMLHCDFIWWCYITVLFKGDLEKNSLQDMPHIPNLLLDIPRGKMWSCCTLKIWELYYTSLYPASTRINTQINQHWAIPILLILYQCKERPGLALTKDVTSVPTPVELEESR
jgi:hypothetical protein